MKQHNKYLTFLGLYIAQSIPMSFFTTVVPVIMRQESYSLESIGLLQLVKLPWILKFLWAPLIDQKANSLKQFKKWIVFSELFYAVIILSIGFFELETDFNLILALIILAIFASATQDIATDALAILTLKKDQQPMGNAIQSAGGFAGAFVGSGVLLLIYNSFGWRVLLFALAGFVIVALIPLKFFNYKLTKKPTESKISVEKTLSFFTQKGMSKHILFLLLSSTGLAGMMSMIKPYMVDHAYPIEEIGYISGILGTITAAITAIISGIILKRVNIKKALIVFTILAALIGFYFLRMNMGEFTKSDIAIGVCMLWGAYGMMNVSVFLLSMKRTRLGLEGTDFTIQIVIYQLGSLIVASLSGLIASKFNYHGLFIAEIALALITVLYIAFVYEVEPQKQTI